MGGEDAGKSEWSQFGSHPRDVDGDTVGLGLVCDPPDICEQLPPGHRLSELFGKPPEQFEFARMQRKPAILDPTVAME